MIYVTGDIHGEVDISKLNTQNFSQAKEGDYLIFRLQGMFVNR